MNLKHHPYSASFVGDISRKHKIIDPNLILRVVCNYYGQNILEVKGKRRHREFSTPRIITMYLIRKHSKMTCKKIGKMFSGRDHTTVINACKTLQNLMDTEPELRKQVREIEFEKL